MKLQEDAGIDIVTDGEQSRQHFVHGFLEFVDGIDFANKVEMGIRNDRYKAMVPTVTGALKLRGRVHGREARHARAHTKRKLKITMPGPMTIIDTIADRHYGDRVQMAFAFADLLNAEARALEADGVDVIQFDEPAFNVYMKEVTTWGVEALHRAIAGLKCATAVHICYGYGIKANIDWKATLGGEWRQYEEIFPALAASRLTEVSVECIHSKVPLASVVAAQGQGRSDRRHRRGERHDRNAGGCRRDHRGRAQARAARSASSPAPIAAWRRCGATSRQPSSTRSAAARRWRASGSADQNTARPLENLLSVAHCLSALALASSASSPRPLRIFAAVGDGVDEFAAGTLRCPGHQLLQARPAARAGSGCFSRYPGRCRCCICRAR